MIVRNFLINFMMATQEDIDRVTDKLGGMIAEVYGWEFPTAQKERVSVRDTR